MIMLRIAIVFEGSGARAAVQAPRSDKYPVIEHMPIISVQYEVHTRQTNTFTSLYWEVNHA